MAADRLPVPRNRAKRYSFQNDSCLVVPGAPIEPDLFAVHEGRIYGFASEGCVEDFTAEPERYLEAPTSAES